MLEDLFLQFGSLGIVAFVVWHNQTRMEKVVSNNTKALVLFNNNINKIGVGKNVGGERKIS